MEVIGFKVEKPIGIGEDLAKALIRALEDSSVKILDGDIIAVTSKVVSYSQGRLVRLSDIKPSAKAVKMALKYDLTPEVAELVIQEADEIVGGVKHYILTIRDGVVLGNAGVDKSNAPYGMVVLPPENPEVVAHTLRREIYEKTGVKTGVLIVDSRIEPLRRGTVGVALAVAGFEPLSDERGKPDIYGKPLLVTRRALADMLASTAELYFGERDELTPFVLIRGAPVRCTDKWIHSNVMFIPREECIFFGSMKHEDNAEDNG